FSSRMTPSCSRQPSTRPSFTIDVSSRSPRDSSPFQGERGVCGSLSAKIESLVMTDADETLAILAEEVTKRYGRFTGVDRIDLGVRRGEVFCLLGPNGSGKTTFIRMLAGYVSPSAGRLLVGGCDVARDGLAAKRKIGYVPESVPLYAHMRVEEFLRFMARLRQL